MNAAKRPVPARSVARSGSGIPGAGRSALAASLRPRKRVVGAVPAGIGRAATRTVPERARCGRTGSERH
jgi:hypothetical protein